MDAWHGSFDHQSANLLSGAVCRMDRSLSKRSSCTSTEAAGTQDRARVTSAVKQTNNQTDNYVLRNPVHLQLSKNKTTQTIYPCGKLKALPQHRKLSANDEKSIDILQAEWPTKSNNKQTWRYQPATNTQTKKPSQTKTKIQTKTQNQNPKSKTRKPSQPFSAF